MAFRKGKKAYKKGIPNKLFWRYDHYLNRLEAQRKSRIKLAKLGILSMASAIQIAQVKAMPIPKETSLTIADKAMSIAMIVKNTVGQFQQILSE